MNKLIKLISSAFQIVSLFIFVSAQVAVEVDLVLVRPFEILTFTLSSSRLPRIFLVVFPDNLVHFVRILPTRDALIRKLTNVRQSIQGTAEISLPSSRVWLVDTSSVAAGMRRPGFEDASILDHGPTLPGSMFPRDFKDAFIAIYPLESSKPAAVCLLFDPCA